MKPTVLLNGAKRQYSSRAALVNARIAVGALGILLTLALAGNYGFWLRMMDSEALQSSSEQPGQCQLIAVATAHMPSLLAASVLFCYIASSSTYHVPINGLRTGVGPGHTARADFNKHHQFSCLLGHAGERVRYITVKPQFAVKIDTGRKWMSKAFLGGQIYLPDVSLMS